MVVSRWAPAPASCPCRHPCAPTRLEWTSSIAHVDYYRCDECGHVWTVPRPLSERTIPTPKAAGGADMMPAAESVTLPIRCPVCKRAVSLTYEPTEAYRIVRWACPYRDCLAEHALDVRGTIVRIAARSEPPIPKPPRGHGGV